MDFNFDEWAELYKTNPEEFERKRARVLKEEIAKAPAHLQADLAATMKRVAIIRATHKADPIAGAVAMNQIMMKKMTELQSALVTLAETALKEVTK
jgi:hypothetical protein